MLNIELLIIDPQIDFCDPNGALYVPGADQDMTRLGEMIRRIKPKLNDIHVTLDSHHLVDIAHPIFWLDASGRHPIPFENNVPKIITVDDVQNGVYRTTNKDHQDRALEYVTKLAANGRYPLTIWPPHCLIASPGACVVPDLFASLLEWESDFAMVDYVTKGSNPWTEHYSAVQADVPDDEDPTTQLNEPLMEILKSADLIPIAGEARSHCLAYTAMDIADWFGEEHIKKFVLLTDATSDVGGCEALGDTFVKDMVARGMQLSTTVDFLR